ncbi:MAG: hypothetical protein LCH30_03140 [Proteobacteria bacterium]|nr:hypothetical protein [Pseudomonadota bacterium]
MNIKALNSSKYLFILSVTLLLIAFCFSGIAKAETTTPINKFQNNYNQLAYYRVYYAHPHWRYTPNVRIYRPGYHRHQVLCKKHCYRNKWGHMRCVRRCYR